MIDNKDFIPFPKASIIGFDCSNKALIASASLLPFETAAMNPNIILDASVFPAPDSPLNTLSNYERLFFT
jgi:hypothetical protein